MRYLLICLLVLCGCQKPKEPQQTLILGTNPTYPPYESIGVDGLVEGFDIDVAQALADKLNKKLVIKELDFDALILALNQGKVDLIMAGISITPARQKEVVLIPYQGEGVKHLCIVFWDTTPETPLDLHTLHPLTVQAGSFQENYLQTVEKMKVKSLEGNTEMIMDLQYGKSKAAVFEPHIADVMQQRFPQLQSITIPLEEEHWVLGNGIGVKKGNRELQQQVQQAVTSLKEEGILENLEAKWMGS